MKIQSVIGKKTNKQTKKHMVMHTFPLLEEKTLTIFDKQTG